MLPLLALPAIVSTASSIASKLLKAKKYGDHASEKLSYAKDTVKKLGLDKVAYSIKDSIKDYANRNTPGYFGAKIPEIDIDAIIQHHMKIVPTVDQYNKGPIGPVKQELGTKVRQGYLPKPEENKTKEKPFVVDYEPNKKTEEIGKSESIKEFEKAAILNNKKMSDFLLNAYSGLKKKTVRGTLPKGYGEKKSETMPEELYNVFETENIIDKLLTKESKRMQRKMIVPGKIYKPHSFSYINGDLEKLRKFVRRGPPKANAPEEDKKN